jgi:hypothetical protein
MDNTYRLIADHGVIGDLQTAALVTTDGAIDDLVARARLALRSGAGDRAAPGSAPLDRPGRS